jgi:hypothetical protein
MENNKVYNVLSLHSVNIDKILSNYNRMDTVGSSIIKSKKRKRKCRSAYLKINYKLWLEYKKLFSC